MLNFIKASLFKRTHICANLNMHKSELIFSSQLNYFLFKLLHFLSLSTFNLSQIVSFLPLNRKFCGVWWNMSISQLLGRLRQEEPGLRLAEAKAGDPIKTN
jgi:hypothetical protein